MEISAYSSIIICKRVSGNTGKIAKLEAFLEKIENMRLLKLAERRVNSKTTSFEEFVNEQGFSMEELEELSESVEFE